MATVIDVMGTPLVIKDNPSKRSKFYKGKGKIFARLPPWFFDIRKLNAAQRQAVIAFADAAAEAAERYPADGTMATLDARREYIANKLAGKVYATTVKVPVHATPEYESMLTKGGKKTPIRKESTAGKIKAILGA